MLDELRANLRGTICYHIGDSHEIFDEEDGDSEAPKQEEQELKQDSEQEDFDAFQLLHNMVQSYKPAVFGAQVIPSGSIPEEFEGHSTLSPNLSCGGT